MSARRITLFSPGSPVAPRGRRAVCAGGGLMLLLLLVYLHRDRGLDPEAAGLAVSCIALAGFVDNPGLAY